MRVVGFDNIECGLMIRLRGGGFIFLVEVIGCLLTILE